MEKLLSSILDYRRSLEFLLTQTKLGKQSSTFMSISVAIYPEKKFLANMDGVPQFPCRNMQANVSLY